MGNAKAGYPAKVKIGANVVANIQSFELPFKMDMAEITALGGTSGAKAFLPTLYGMVVKLSGKRDMADTNGQKALRTAMFARTTVNITCDMLGDTSETYTFDAWVSGYTPKTDVGSVNDAEFELTMNGAVTIV